MSKLTLKDLFDKFLHLQIEGHARWYFYLIVLLCSTLFAFWTMRRDPKTTFYLVGVTAIIVLVPSLIAHFFLVQAEDRSHVFKDFSGISTAFILIIGTIIWGHQKHSNWSLFATTTLVAMTTLAFFNTWWKPKSLLFLPLLALGAQLLRKDLFNDKYSSRRHSRIASAVLLLCSAGLAIRIDSLETSGSYHHNAYLIGVIQTIKSGGLLFWDTPSQYGFLNMIFASLFPISNSTYSLLYFQAILLIFVSALAIWAIRTISPDRSWVFLGLTFTLMLYFSNPNGPQQFPSTSVMRFGPSVIIFILLSMSQGYSHSALVSKVLPISGAVAMLWSFESFFYTSMIFAGWVLCYEHTAGHSLMRKLQVFSTIFKVFPATVSIIFLYCTYVFIEVGKLPTLQWFYLFASEYAKGFGQLPIDPWGSGQLFIAGIFACTLVLSVADPRTRPICGAGLGGLLGWLTYFVGRASPSNIVNMFPLVFIAVLIPTLSLRRSLNSQNAPKNRENSPKNSKPDSLIALRASAAILLAFGALFIASFGTYSNIPKFVSYYRALPGSVVVEPSAIEMGYQLDALLNSVELRHLPLAYVGNSGSLPPLSEKSWNSLDQYGTWLPLPLALLEAPISHEVRMTVLARRHERFQRDGYLVWDKQRTIAGVAETWIEDLYYSSHSCRVIVDNEFWQLNECIAQPFLRIETGKNSPTYSVME